MNYLINFFRIYLIFPAILLSSVGYSQTHTQNVPKKKSVALSYSFQDSIPEKVLRCYLRRAITMAEFATGKEFYVDSDIPDRKDDERMILNISAKFIGRSAYLWGQEYKAAKPAFFEAIRTNTSRMHQRDPDLIFQACIFEIVTTEVNKVPVPEYVFQAFGLKSENRHFDYQKMLFPDGNFVDHWSKDASVPDVTQLETRLWFYFLATSYIDAGMEAIHWGQVRLTGSTDEKNGLKGWKDVLDQVRKYAKEHARRGWILCDGHTPFGGLVVEGQLLLDFHSFPLRIKENPPKSMEGRLEMGYLDAFYGRSKGGMTPSG